MTRVLTTALVLMAALSAVATVDLPDNGQVVVDRLMDSEWHQRRPFNDFMPIDWANMPSKGNEVKNESKRGRMTCGCVADAMGQILRYFKWPVRLDKAISFEHNWKNERNPEKPWLEEPYESPVTGKMEFRVEGHVPFEYASMTNVWEAVFKDARGTFPEIDRYPAARLIQTVGVLLQMDYRTTDSGSYPYTMTEQMTDWYETPNFKTCNGSFANGKADILACLQAGIPVTASLPGHQIVIHGYAKVGEDDYVFVAWDNRSEDGWVDASTLEINEACIGFKPKKMVQLEPLRAVEDASVTVRWTLPGIWTSDVTGFTVVATPAGGVAVTKSVGAADRACTFTGLTPGQSYSFHVSPTITGAVVSPSVTTTIATAAKPALAWPTIEVWGPTTNVFGETWYHENATDKGFVYVRCPTSVTDLSVVSGNLTVLPQDKISVRSYGAGHYAVVFDGSNVTNVPSSAGISSMNRQRMIATLVATDANGTSVYKNLSLRFSSDTPIAEPDGLTPSDPDPGPGADPAPSETTNAVPLSVNLGFVMTADNVMKVTYDVATNGVLRTWEDGTFTFTESGAGRNLWRGDGNQNIGTNIRVKKFLSGTWAGFPVPNTNLEQPDGIVAGKYWEIDVPFDLRVALAVTNVFPKAFITTSAGADTDGGQPVSNNKQLDVTVAVLSPDKATTQAVTTVRTGVLGATRVNEVVGALTTTLSNGVLRIRVAHGAGACTGAFGGIQGVSFTGSLAVVGGESGGDGDGGQGDGGDDPVLPVVVGTNVVVAPLTSQQWNQGRHYNRMCPLGQSDNPDGRMYAGCTAVATSILLAHYQWPLYGTGDTRDLEKSWPTDTVWQRFRGGIRTYDWENMRDFYGYVVSPESSLAVAALISDVGAALNTHYGEEGSSATFGDVETVLSRNFGFSLQGMRFIDHSPTGDNGSFTAADHQDIQAQLRAGHPILCSGKVGGGTSGHTYICDGYAVVRYADNSTTNLYHFNFGWGGSSNGWFPLEAVVTQATVSDTPMARPVQGMLLNVLPSRVPQFLPRPSVTGSRVTIDWRVANCWTNSLTGFSVERQKRVQKDASRTFTAADWWLNGTGWGWQVSGENLVARMGSFGSSSYWPGWGALAVATVPPVAVSADTSLTITYQARKFKSGVALKLVKVVPDDETTPPGYSLVYNGAAVSGVIRTLEGGTSENGLTEKTVTVTGAELAAVFGSAEAEAHFGLLFETSGSEGLYAANTEVFRLTSFSVGGKAFDWVADETTSVGPACRQASFDGLADGDHRFVVTPQYSDDAGDYPATTEQRVQQGVTPPSVRVTSTTADSVTFTVSDSTSFDYEFECQSTALRAKSVSVSGNDVTYVFNSDVSGLGTHWLTMQAVDRVTKAKALCVHVTNPPERHPLADCAAASLGEAVARAQTEGKQVLLLSSGDPDGKISKMPAVLESPDVVNAVSGKFVFVECQTTTPDGLALSQKYWRAQPRWDYDLANVFAPLRKAYFYVIDPAHPDVAGPVDSRLSGLTVYMSGASYKSYLNTQLDIANIVSDTSTAADVVRFLGQDFVVDTPAVVEPSVEGGDASAAIVRNADGEYVVTPAGDGGGQYVMINNVGTHVIAVPPSVACVIGVPASQLKVRVGDVDITTAFARCGDAGGLYLELNADGVVTNGNEILTVRPALTSSDDAMKPLTVGATVDVGVRTIPGLKYTLWRGTALEGLKASVEEQAAHVADEWTAEGTRTQLIDHEPPAGRAFYVIQVERPCSAGQP